MESRAPGQGGDLGAQFRRMNVNATSFVPNAQAPTFVPYGGQYGYPVPGEQEKERRKGGRERERERASEGEPRSGGPLGKKWRGALKGIRACRLEMKISELFVLKVRNGIPCVPCTVGILYHLWEHLLSLHIAFWIY